MEKVTSKNLLSPLKPWLEDPLVSEIMLNKPGEIYIERKGVVRREAVIGLHLLHIMRFLQLVANENSVVFDAHTPLLSGCLYEQSRIQAVLPPVSRNVCFSIRKHGRSARCWDSLMTSSYFDLGRTESTSIPDPLHPFLERAEWSSFLQAAVCAKKTLLIAGETGSGKTTLLNVLLSSIRSQERLIVLEDTPELSLSSSNSLFLLACQDDFLSRPIGLSELLKAALRLRPDRIILGELRSDEAYDFVSACQTGHGGSMATIHAGSPQQALERLSQLYLQRSGSTVSLEVVNRLIENTIDIVVQLSRRSGRPSITGIYYQGHLY